MRAISAIESLPENARLKRFCSTSGCRSTSCLTFKSPSGRRLYPSFPTSHHHMASAQPMRQLRTACLANSEMPASRHEARHRDALRCMINILGLLGATSERRHYQARGYQIFRSAFPAGEVERVAAMARQQIPVHGAKLRRQDGEFAANDFFPGTQLVRNSLLHPHIALPDSFSELRDSLCRLVTSPALGEPLRRLDGSGRH